MASYPFPSQDGATALIEAVREEKIDITLLLLDRGADTEAKDKVKELE